MKMLALWQAEYLEVLCGRGLKPGTVNGCRVILDEFRRWWGKKDPLGMKRSDLVAWMKGLYERGLKPDSQTTYTNTVLRFVRHLAHRGYLEADPGEGLRPRQQIKTLGRKIPSADQMAEILQSIESPRDRALFELMYASGLRFFEAVGLLTSDVNLETRIALVRQGKGGKDRYVPFSIPARDALRRWIEIRQRQVLEKPGKFPELVFPGEGGSLSWSHVDRRWKSALKVCQLEGQGYTLHCIRHACATHLLEGGAQVRYVQELLGHESLSTTQRYARPTAQRIKAVYRSCHPRENLYYEEVTPQYRQEVEKLRAELLANREKKARWVRLEAEKAKKRYSGREEGNDHADTSQG